jgi:predicted nucleic acid-binding protein
VTRLLLHVNVVLDLLLDREPFAAAAKALWASAELERIEVLLPAHGVTTIFYITSRERDARFARRVVQEILSVAAVAPVDGGVLDRAFTLPCPDFEDAVCQAAAEAADCSILVTRDPSGYRGAGLPVLDPDTAVALLSGTEPGGVAELSRRRARRARHSRR